MRNLLLAAAAVLAAAAITAAPATAQSAAAGAFAGASSHGSGQSGSSQFVNPGWDRHDRHRRRGDNGDVFIGEWPQQGDTVWRSNSFNDWWHDRPDRAFPRWVQNGKCERPWWHGDTLSC